MTRIGRRLVVVFVVAVGMVAITACGSDSSDGTAPSPQTDGTTESGGTGAATPAPDSPANDDSATETRGSGDANAVEVAVASLDGLETLGGGSYEVNIADGQPAIVWFWAPWCPNCRAMGPGLADLAAEYDGRIAVIGVAGRGEVSEMDGFVTDTGTGEIDHVVDSDGSIWSEFGVSSQPAFAFIDSNGDVEVLVGRQSQGTMTQRFEQLLAS